MLGVSIVLFVVLLAVLFAVAAVTAGFGDLMKPVFQDARPVGMPEQRVTPDDLEALRFNVVLRGYKMSEVDAVLHRMAREIAERDAVLAELRGDHAPVAFRRPPPPGSDEPTELLSPADAPAYDERTELLPATPPTGPPSADADADTDEQPVLDAWAPEPPAEAYGDLHDAPTGENPVYDSGDATAAYDSGEATAAYDSGDATAAYDSGDWRTPAEADPSQRIAAVPAHVDPADAGAEQPQADASQRIAAVPARLDSADSADRADSADTVESADDRGEAPDQPPAPPGEQH